MTMTNIEKKIKKMLEKEVELRLISSNIDKLIKHLIRTLVIIGNRSEDITYGYLQDLLKEKHKYEKRLLRISFNRAVLQEEDEENLLNCYENNYLEDYFVELNKKLIKLVINEYGTYSEFIIPQIMEVLTRKAEEIRLDRDERLKRALNGEIDDDDDDEDDDDEDNVDHDEGEDV